MRLSRHCCSPPFLLAVLAAVTLLRPGFGAEDTQWRVLFDGKTLEGWKITNFGGEGEVTVENGMLLLEFGSSLTGVTYQGKLPTSNYELSLEAQRLDGIDFFCGLTFPVGESHCSLIVGGWGGAVVGLSSIDGRDASENETTQYMNFEKNRWYRIRARVEPDRIQVWIDDKQVVNLDTRGRRIGMRIEVDLSKPLGIAAWETRAAVRNIRIRALEIGDQEDPEAGDRRPETGRIGQIGGSEGMTNDQRMTKPE